MPFPLSLLPSISPFNDHIISGGGKPRTPHFRLNDPPTGISDSFGDIVMTRGITVIFFEFNLKKIGANYLKLLNANQRLQV